MSGVLVGIDAGLTRLKAVAMSGSGERLASASAPTPGADAGEEDRTADQGQGQDQDHHQDQEALWAATAELVRTLLEGEAVDPEAVTGVGVAGHGHGLYALDEAGEPVCGIRSTTDRASGLLAAWREDGRLERAADRLGWEPFGADPYCLLGWVDRERPAVADRIDTVLFCKDVLTHRLTGARTTDPMDGSALVPPDGDVEGVFETLGLAEYADAVPDRVDSTAACGSVTERAAAETGLPAGTPVAAGLHDVGACALGAGVVGPGQATAILGTWGQSVVVVEGPHEGTGGLPRRYLDGWLRYRGTRAGAACLDWFVEAFGDRWRATARERGVDPYAVYEQRAEAVPPGANGVVFRPYLNGSTDDPDARGGFHGLGLETDRADLLRAVYEGVAAALALGVEAFDVEVTDLRVTGGGARSRLWTRLLAAFSGGPVRVPAAEETGARGAAICAGVAAGRYAGVEAAVSEAVDVRRRHEPTPERVERYRAVADAVRELDRRLEGAGGLAGTSASPGPR
jgi:sugar (pentulose or hexulose) kinase